MYLFYVSRLQSERMFGGDDEDGDFLSPTGGSVVFVHVVLLGGEQAN